MRRHDGDALRDQWPVRGRRHCHYRRRRLRRPRRPRRAAAQEHLAFEFGDEFFRSPIFNGIVMITVAALMVSRVPTFSMKRFRIPHHYVLPVMLAIAVVAAFLTTAPWPTLSAVGILYIASIPLTVLSFNRLRREAAAQAKASSEIDLAAAPPHHDGPTASRLPH